MDLTSILNGVAIGKDATGNFRPSIEGLAVRTLPDGKFWCMKGHQLLDVSDLTLDGADAYVYRLPVQKGELKPGDLIITSENPSFSVLFIVHVRDNGQVNGLSPGASPPQIIEYTPPANLFIKAPLYVKVVSLLDGFDHEAGAESLLPLLLLANKGDNPSPNDPLTMLLVSQAFGGKVADKKLLPLLLLTGAKSDGLETLLLMQAFGGTHPLAGLFGQGTTHAKKK